MCNLYYFDFFVVVLEKIVYEWVILLNKFCLLNLIYNLCSNVKWKKKMKNYLSNVNLKKKYFCYEKRGDIVVFMMLGYWKKNFVYIKYYI